MNGKTVLILERLLDGRPHKLRDLAQRLEISVRLVRYEMQEVDAFLRREGFPALQYERPAGLRLMLTQAQHKALSKKLASLDTYDYAMTSAERRCVMTLMLIASGGEALTGQYFADQLGVSKSSIDKDMALLKTDLLGSGVRLESRVGKGSTLEGEEQALRHCGVRLLEQHVDFAGLYSGDAEGSDMVGSWACRLFCGEELSALFELLRSMEQAELGKWLGYDSFRMLTFTLAVTLVRVRAGKAVQAVPASMALVKTSGEYVHAVHLAGELEKRFEVRLPAGEVYALAILLAGAKYVTPEPYLKEDWAGVQVLLDRLVRGMSEEMDIAFTEDEEIYNALQAHMGPTVFRLRHDIPITNPNLQEIRKNYAVCFEALERVLKKLDSELLAGITEDDIAYLVLHFCAAMERSKRMMPVSRVAIVCVHGAGTANLLRELVCSKFKNIRVVATATYTDLHALEKMDVDFVIASIPLPDCKVPWVKVETIPTAENWEAISRMALKYGAKGRAHSDAAELFKDVMKTIQAHCEVRDVDGLMASLAASFEAAGIPVRADRVQPALAQLLSPQKVLCRRRAAGWEDAVRQACAVLVQAGDVTEEFTISAIQSVRSAGPYIVIMPGVALVHSELGKGVKRLAMSLVTFENDVCFHHPANDPVRLVLCLAPTDNWAHLRALRGLLSLLNKVPVRTLCAASTPQELCEYIKESCE